MSSARRCPWPFKRHDWSRWGAPQQQRIKNWWNGRVVSYDSRTIQSSECGRCGKVKTRVIEAP